MLLMEEGERIAREEHFSNKISVISGANCVYNNLIIAKCMYCIIPYFNVSDQSDCSITSA